MTIKQSVVGKQKTRWLARVGVFCNCSVSSNLNHVYFIFNQQTTSDMHMNSISSSTFKFNQVQDSSFIHIHNLIQLPSLWSTLLQLLIMWSASKVEFQGAWFQSLCLGESEEFKTINLVLCHCNVHARREEIYDIALHAVTLRMSIQNEWAVIQECVKPFCV